jgi:hypothetical protein
LIVLEIRKRTTQPRGRPRELTPSSSISSFSKRPVLLQTHPGTCGQARSTTGMLSLGN